MTSIIQDKRILLVGTSICGVACLMLIASFVFANETGPRVPQADGHYAEWTPSTTSVARYTLVDDLTCNNSDRVFTTTAGDRDSYDLGGASSTVTITAIAISPCAAKYLSATSTPSQLDVFYRFNGVDSTATGAYMLTATSVSQLASTTFSGLSLEVTPTSTLEIGAKLTSGADGAQMSNIVTIITYTP